MKLIAVPMTIKDANEFVGDYHRHNKPVVGARFAIGFEGDELVGVAIVGRPVSRHLDNGLTAEVAVVLRKKMHRRVLVFLVCSLLARLEGDGRHQNQSMALKAKAALVCAVLDGLSFTKTKDIAAKAGRHGRAESNKRYQQHKFQGVCGMTDQFINRSALTENFTVLPNALLNDDRVTGEGLALDGLFAVKAAVMAAIAYRYP